MANFVKSIWQNHRWPRLTATAILITIAIALAVVGGIFTWLGWEWLRASEDGKASNGDTLRNVGFIVAGVVALAIAVWRGVVAGRQANAAQRQTAIAQEQAETAQESLLNERYQRGAEMLGSPVLSVRLGGIYALQRLAEEHPEQYHLQVMRLFCAFVRNPIYMEEEAIPDEELRPDVQAAIIAIGQRGNDVQRLETQADFRLDLRAVHLAYADMEALNFAGVDLGDAYFVGSNLLGIRLPHANLAGADLSGTNLRVANLSRTHLWRANLTGVDLMEADLPGANLLEANLSGANLDGAQLPGANLREANLFCTDLSEANLSGATLARAKLSGANFERAIVSGIRLGTQPRFTATGQIILPGGYTPISQRQLDQTVADLDNPPIIPDGATDPETDEPLVWRGQPLNPQS